MHRWLAESGSADTLLGGQYAVSDWAIEFARSVLDCFVKQLGCNCGHIHFWCDVFDDGIEACDDLFGISGYHVLGVDSFWQHVISPVGSANR